MERSTPGASQDVVVLDDPDPLIASELGRVTSDGGGLFGDLPGAAAAFELNRSDRTRVYAATLDGAGNLSPRVDVKSGRWIATIGGKVLRSLFENPHELDLRSRFVGCVEQPELRRLDGNSGLDLLGGAPESEVVQASWRELSGGAPVGRDQMSMVFDAARGRVVMIGGRIGNLDPFTPEAIDETVRSAELARSREYPIRRARFPSLRRWGRSR